VETRTASMGMEMGSGGEILFPPHTKQDFFGGQKVVSDFAAWTEKIPQVNYGMHTYAIEDILAVGMQDYLKGKDLDKVLEDAQKQAEEQIK
jgi:lactose/L-arabinose transport system substrate-binding protein